ARGRARPARRRAPPGPARRRLPRQRGERARPAARRRADGRAARPRIARRSRRMNEERELAAFVERVTAELGREGRDVLRHPAMRALAEGRLPIEGVRAWARQFWHCIRTSARSFANVHANLCDEDLDLRRELAANIFEEDAGGISKTDNHNALFLEFARALG